MISKTIMTVTIITIGLMSHGVLERWRGQYGRVITLRGLIRHRYELFIQIIENALFCILLMLQMV